MRHQTEVEIDNFDLFFLKGGVYYIYPIIHTHTHLETKLGLGIRGWKYKQKKKSL